MGWLPYRPQEAQVNSWLRGRLLWKPTLWELYMLRPLKLLWKGSSFAWSNNPEVSFNSVSAWEIVSRLQEFPQILSNLSPRARLQNYPSPCKYVLSSQAGQATGPGLIFGAELLAFTPRLLTWRPEDIWHSHPDASSLQICKVISGWTFHQKYRDPRRGPKDAHISVYFW